MPRKNSTEKPVSNIIGTKNDNNNKFNIDKLIAMDPIELSKLIKLYPEYQRYYGPLFTEDIWSHCLETFYLKAHLFDKEKSGNKLFGWFNTLVYHVFLYQIKRNKSKKQVDLDFVDDYFGLKYDDSFQNIASEEFNLGIIDGETDEDNRLNELIEKYASEKEKIPIKLFLAGVKTTKEETDLVYRFKKRVMSRIYTKEQLAEFKKKKKGLLKNKNAVRRRETRRNYIAGLPKEERERIRIEKKNARRQKVLDELQRKGDIKGYKEMIKRFNRSDSQSMKKHNEQRSKELKKKQKEKLKEQERLRKEILKKESKNNDTL